MVSSLGELDWGPVVGGYLGAMLLGALYVSIGLCVSARTDNQVVSLMLTLLIGGALYLVGTDSVTALFGNQWAEALRSIGTGARFESIERGVVDLRDLVYYGGMTAFFLVLNHAFLETDRVDQNSPSGRAKAKAAWGLVALAAGNAIAAVVWLTPVTSARLDLTANGDFSVSHVTQDVLSELHEPMFIDGYFSERTHPLLAPLVPQIRDLLAEYEVAGRGKVTVSISDPNTDEDLEVELAEQYSIRSVPFQVEDRHQQAVVNSFFHILVRYGDQYEVLSFNDLIEFYADAGGADVRLRNLEYDLTRTVKRVSQDFQTLASVMEGLPEPAKLTAYATPSSMPEEFGAILELVKKVGEDVAQKGGDKLTFSVVDPTGDQALQEKLFQDYGLRPLAVDLFATQTFYLDLVLTMGDQVERLVPRGDVKEADLEKAVESALKRVTPGQLTTLGVLTETPAAPPPNPQIPPQFQPPPPQPDYQALKQLMGELYEVQEVDAANGEVPATIDVLIVGKPGALSEEQKFAIDQFLMRGGRVIALASAHKVEVGREGIQQAAMDTGLLDMLSTYGVTVSSDFVLDAQNASFPRPKIERRGGFQLQRIEMTPYPFFVDVRTDGMQRGHPAVAGLNSITLPWGSPITVQAPEGVESTILAHSTADAWTYGGTSLEPSSPTGETAEYPLAVVLSGTFPSFYAERPSPLFEGDANAAGADATGRTIKASLPDARLAVVGSAELVSDLILQLAQQPGGEVHRGNLQLIQNLVDWSVEDTDLLEIRTAGAYARTLRPLEDSERDMYEWGQYILALFLLGLVASMPRRMRGQLPTLRFDRVEQS
jgi:ABC-2 type transport system permease protein